MHLHKLSVRVSSAALILFAAAAAPAAAADPTSPSNEAAVANSAPAHSTEAPPAEPKKICRTIETTSSRLKTTKVCLTREQWHDAKYH